MTDEADVTNDIKLRFGRPDDFAALRSLRGEVFCDELGIQERSYHDVIFGWYSKNVVLLAGNRLIGAVRLAYIRDWQEYYVSYLCLAAQYRRKAHLRLLFGAIILLMKRNGIRSIRADSSDANLMMYQAMGCVPIGGKFKKPGFVCDWTPMRYDIGVNAAAEESLSERAAAHFEPWTESDLTWVFDTVFHRCDTASAFGATFETLLEKDLIPGHLPYLARPDRVIDLPHDEAFTRHLRTVEVRSDDDEFFSATSTASPTRPACPDRTTITAGSRFAHLNARFSSKTLVAVLVDSEALVLARLYAVLTCKRLVELNDWGELPSLCPPSVSSVTAIIGPADRALSKAVLSAAERRCAIGLLTAADLPALSSTLLGSYLNFIGPTQVAIAVHPVGLVSYEAPTGACGRGLGPGLWSLAGGPEMTVVAIGPYHLLIVPARICRAAVAAISEFLKVGYAIGQSVRLVREECLGDEPILLMGDPSLRLDIAPSEKNAEATRRLAAVSD
ncbi:MULTISPECIES: hypothetical protein [unclassified Bradyrhizobium]|uniref:hypothetical protein n=1 Tax=unclassified Bradyrhizobium TaxID=2631580 RepID=UPI002916AA0F|nr:MULTISPECIES: hypothetical protein [unclassified Bradyrhizobium]